MKGEGMKGFYTGYGSTICRGIPFSLIQFPLWEYLKRELERLRGQPASPWDAACCGSVAGSVSGILTTPLDVAKTRVMLGQGRGGTLQTIRHVYEAGGIGELFSGVAPRTCFIGAGGFVFFLAYEA